MLPLLRTHTLDAHEMYRFDGVEYPYVLVMQRGEEDLSGAIAHARMTARMPPSLPALASAPLPLSLTMSRSLRYRLPPRLLFPPAMCIR